jgi:hypothetical protein
MVMAGLRRRVLQCGPSAEQLVQAVAEPRGVLEGGGGGVLMCKTDNIVGRPRD